MQAISLRFLVTVLLAVVTWHTTTAQVLPSDESLTDGPATKRIGDPDTTAIISTETIPVASPSKVRRRGRVDSSYVDTVGVGFFKKILAPVYPNPERAAALSFVLPGAGQVYNKRFAYIKIPVIYAGYAALIYNGETNRKLRNTFGEAYELSLEGQPIDPSLRFATAQQLRTARDAADKNFQLSYIGVAILHLVQTLEAYTTSHLLNFDMDESLTIAPTVVQPPTQTLSIGPSHGRLALGMRYTFPTK